MKNLEMAQNWGREEGIFIMLVVDGCDPPIPPDAVVKLP